MLIFKQKSFPLKNSTTHTYYDSIVKNTLTGDDKNMAKWRPHWMGIYAYKHSCSVNKKTENNILVIENFLVIS